MEIIPTPETGISNPAMTYIHV